MRIYTVWARRGNRGECDTVKEGQRKKLTCRRSESGQKRIRGSCPSGQLKK
ncbi:hypothetical protein C1H46_045916 [Malus baccata]|uniref:Uncharacterized protein n=1 Tax=Malus baccata TaxID=106549 RepID=A0A540K2P5_MALBA|nr:hypothetical protein C1H46_045916 [Malus baccata]